MEKLVPYRVLLVSTYDLGHQPFGVVSSAAWVRRTGALIRCIDLSRERFRVSDFEEADFIAFYLSMHTATRLAAQVIPRVSQLNRHAHLCAYGLYAPMNEDFLRALGIMSVIGGEFEEELEKLILRLMNGQVSTQPLSTISLKKQQFLVPDRTLLPELSNYSHLMLADGTSQITGYTMASRGCKHLCRHCPIVPIYQGRFRIVQREVVLEDVCQQVHAGARHITFGDPDFFNGISHAIALVRAFHDEFPNITYDVTIKIEHLVRYVEQVSVLKETGCAFVTSAVESIDDGILRILEKGHTRADFLSAVEMCRKIGLPLAPTFVSFTPWLTLDGYEEMLRLIADLGIVGWIAPVQWAIRLLIPNGSRLLELPEVHAMLAGFEPSQLSYRWVHPDSRMDHLQQRVEGLVRTSTNLALDREQVFEGIWRLLLETKGQSEMQFLTTHPLVSRCTIPYLTEPWYC